MQRKIKIAVTLLFTTLLGNNVLAGNAIPVISNISITVDSSINQILVGYDLVDAESDPVEISVTVSDDFGETYLADITTSGDVGYPIDPGSTKSVTIQYTPSSTAVKNLLVKLVADDQKEMNIQELVNKVSSERLREDLLFVEGTRHYITGTAHLEEVKDFIEQRFIGEGLRTSRQEVVKGGYTGHNIISRLPGHDDESKTYIIDGHFDTVDDTPGADDNGTGTVGMLEAMRVMSKYNFKYSIRFIGFDFEETVGTAGLAGSLAYAQNGIEDYETIEGVVNFEMIGFFSEEDNSQTIPSTLAAQFPDVVNEVAADNYRGNFIVSATEVNSLGLSDAFENSSSMYVPQLKIHTLQDPFGGGIPTDLSRSDHFSFWLNDIPAIMLTDGAEYRNTNYHTPDDTIGALNFTFMSNVVKAAVATVAELAGIQHSSFKVVNMSGQVIQQMTPPVGIKELSCDFQLLHLAEADQLLIHPGLCFHDKIRITIFSIEGKYLNGYDVKSQPQLYISTGDLVPGLYIAVVEDGLNRASTQFFVK